MIPHLWAWVWGLAGMGGLIGIALLAIFGGPAFKLFTDIAGAILTPIAGVVGQGASMLVKAEIGARESGRGYLSIGGKLPGIQKIKPGSKQNFFGRYRQLFANAGFTAESAEGGQIAIVLGNSKVGLGVGLNKPKAQKAVAASLDEIREDMLVYVRRKRDEAAQKFGLKG